MPLPICVTDLESPDVTAASGASAKGTAAVVDENKTNTLPTAAAGFGLPCDIWERKTGAKFVGTFGKISSSIRNKTAAASRTGDIR